ncbi:hypothetical protein [Caenispirillum bisanense]|uniref:Uncharacterized protein n=1 Tax=Caenispirillum bisanense TaxID=414052 RepID=A0A286GKQ8_9PROT|nr:hypothetical protein [Caenispirillum bisanense]SOD96121.1 hypothetical protein SAMN05421508_105166 [Caenispirillum bisanense]
MRFTAPAAALATVALLAACAPDTASTDAVGTATPGASAPTTTAPQAAAGPSFPEALIEAYGAMAQFEDRAGSPQDAVFFRNKQTLVATSALPEPEPAPTDTLAAARGDLMAALGYREAMPVRVATAQAAYDCWANDARSAAQPVPIDCPRLFRDTIQEIAAAR